MESEDCGQPVEACEMLSFEMLPDLPERFEALARSESKVEWARGFFESYLPGMLHLDGEGGFALQVLHPNTVRVVQIFDAIHCFTTLRMAIESMMAAGIEVQIEGFAHITPPPQESLPPEEGSRVPVDEAGLDSADLAGMMDEVDGMAQELGAIARTASDEIGMWC